LAVDLIEKTREFLRGRSAAYRRTFNKGDMDDRFVLADLARFCRAHDSTAHADPHIAARLDGRREVWLRIAQHLNLDDETLWRLYGGPNARGNQ
jgi:hypothetical protein